ncbi:GIY-YIG nuclease family protein [Haloferax sp. DFSO52]|uniref:GIY-YIG nuclease family protein n=1 Tax=Haloferax sp. DFSO52 TaxID=3388505 RepID=UPI003A88B094
MTVHSISPDVLGTEDDPLKLGTQSPRGTYALVYRVPEITAEVGALGTFDLEAGGYVYVGSAFGSGGLRRVLRHRRVAAGEHDARHWHVDYLGGYPAVELDHAVCVVGTDVECAVADSLGTAALSGFGSSDCDCEAHLTRFEDVETASSLVEAVVRLKS